MLFRPVNLALHTMRLVKFEHSVFALPFALAAAFLAVGGTPKILDLILVVAACVFARTSAMSFNRFADASLDAENPRTSGREIPRGVLKRRYALGLTVLSACLFAGTAWLINTLAFYLSPVALLVLLGYSYTKRITSFSHFFLGAALGMAPVGAWIAMDAELSVVPHILGLAVLLWTAGFDIIYACQDVHFDREKKLRSLPALLGVAPALWVSRGLHLATLGCLVCVGIAAPDLGWLYYVGCGLAGGMLLIEQSLVRPDDLSRVNAAFFTVNGFVSVIFMLFTIADIMLEV